MHWVIWRRCSLSVRCYKVFFRGYHGDANWNGYSTPFPARQVCDGDLRLGIGLVGRDHDRRTCLQSSQGHKKKTRAFDDRGGCPRRGRDGRAAGRRPDVSLQVYSL